MGNKISVVGFTEEMLDDYACLTYLSKHEILSLLKLFCELGKDELEQNFHHRFPCAWIEEILPNIKHNPFRDRLYWVFSSRKDYKFSFEDLLDLCSVMSQNCPDKVKAAWAFKIFDFDNNEQIDESDIRVAIDRILGVPNQGGISQSDKQYIAKTLLNEINIQNTGFINNLEFEHAVGKMSEFAQTFSFTI